MRIRVSDPRKSRELVRFLRGREYLAVAHHDGPVEAVPINSISERADRVRMLRDLADWMAENPGLEATLEN
jgi:hypothetical protein